MQKPIHLRFFLSSPGDLAEERALARDLIKSELTVDPFIRERATLDVVSWDDPHAPVGMPTHLTPQEAINQGLPRPAQCDVVIVLFWTRMGTPLPENYRKANGEPFFSGTEWEFEDALEAAKKHGRPTLLVYRRDHKPKKASEQFRKVQRFFEKFRGPDGSMKMSFHHFSKPEQFKELLRHHLRDFINRRLNPPADLSKTVAAPAFTSKIEAFFSEYLLSEIAPVPFGGRNAELSLLDAWLHEEKAPSRFLITAPAGRGKSALLVRWLEQLRSQAKIGKDGWAAVFIPVSIRFGLNAHRVLSAGAG